MKIRIFSSFVLAGVLVAAFGSKDAFSTKNHHRKQSGNLLQIEHTNSDNKQTIRNIGNTETTYSGSNYQFNEYDQRSYGISLDTGSGSAAGIGRAQINNNIHDVGGNVNFAGSVGMGMGMGDGGGAFTSIGMGIDGLMCTFGNKC